MALASMSRLSGERLLMMSLRGNHIHAEPAKKFQSGTCRRPARHQISRNETAASGASVTNRRRGRNFKFLECDDDNRLASIAKEKSGLGLDRRASNLAGVADHTSRPHLLHFRSVALSSSDPKRGNDYRRWQFHYQQIRTAITVPRRSRPATEAGLRCRRPRIEQLGNGGDKLSRRERLGQQNAVGHAV